jgi:gas vesicle protein
MACGLVVGAVAGVLLAPASGAETRRRLRFEGDNAIDAAKLRARRLARVRRARPEEEEEEAGAFSGA